MPDANLLEVDDDQPRLVQHLHLEEDPERATPDDDGVLRDAEGRAYSAGAYRIVGTADDEPIVEVDRGP